MLRGLYLETMTGIQWGDGGEDESPFSSKKDAWSARILHVLFLTAVVGVFIPLFLQAVEPIPVIEAAAESLPMLLVAGIIGTIVLLLHAAINEATSRFDLKKDMR